MRLLFFLERELHLPMLLPVMREAHQRGLGEIGLSTVQYLASSEGVPGRGLRRSAVEEVVDFPIEFVNDPFVWKPDITFMADFSYQYVEGLGKIVNIGHGTIGKGWYFSPGLISRRENCADLLCVPGEVHAEALSAQVFQRIAITGMPKLDAVFRGKWNREELLRGWNLDPANKTVLFAPTFNSEFSIVPHIGHELRRYIPDYLNILIKLHGAAPEEQKRAYRAYAEAHANVAYSESPDIAPALAAADVLVSDVSSVVYEFLSLGKPVVLFDSPTMQQYAGYDENDLEHRFRDAGCRFSSPDKLSECLFKSLVTPMSEAQRELGRRFVSVRDGGSAGRVLDEALALLEHHEPKAAIVLRDRGGDVLPILLEKWQARYQLFVATDHMERANGAVWLQPAESPFAMLRQAIPQVRADKVIYFDCTRTPSPMLPDFLLMHMHFLQDAGIVHPLVAESDEVTMQTLGMHVHFRHEIDPELIGWQLTYSMTGQAKPVDLLHSDVFAFRREVWSDTFTDVTDDRLSWLELLRNAHLKGYRSYLALDACVRRPAEQRPVERKAPVMEDEATRLKRAIEDNPSDRVAIKRLVRYYFEKADWDMLDVYAAMLPGDVEVTLWKAHSLMQQDFPEQALRELEAVDSLSISNRDLLFQLLTERGRLYIKLNQVPNAIRHLTEALALQPDSVTTMVHLASCHMLQNNAVEAAAQLEQALAIDPVHVDALYGMGLIHHTQGRREQAEDLFAQILSQNPTHMKTLKTMLQFAYESRRFAPVERHLQRYLEQKNDDLSMRYVLAGVLYEQEKLAEAQQQVEVVLSHDPTFHGAAELRDRINSRIYS